jgi:hypothetical protein
LEPRQSNRSPSSCPTQGSDEEKASFTQLTNAFSKKLANLKAAVALHFAYYNFCRVYSSLRVTPAMEAGLTDHIWGLSELLQA